MLSKKLLINSISLKMTSTEIALLLNNDSEKIIRIGEIIGKKIKKRDNFEELNEFEKTFIYIDIFENHTTVSNVNDAPTITDLKDFAREL